MFYWVFFDVLSCLYKVKGIDNLIYKVTVRSKGKVTFMMFLCRIWKLFKLYDKIIVLVGVRTIYKLLTYIVDAQNINMKSLENLY